LTNTSVPTDDTENAMSVPPTELPSAADAPAVEQRSRPRHCCGTITLTRMSLAAAERTYFAWVHDISEHGIGLDVLAPLPTGADLIFEMKRGEDAANLRLYARVVHATPAGTFYRLGCRFTRPLRPRVLASVLQRVHGRQ
jgi:hypothetical protein